MNPLEKNRAICYGKGATHAKSAMISRLQQDFAKHFADSIDYEPECAVNGEHQVLIVSKNKSVTNERKIFAYPGQTFYTGDVVDCYNTKWLVTEVDQNKQIYTSGIMQLCNCELIWQNKFTGEIIRRWVTAEKPYYSNLDESKEIVVSSREFKIQIPYDEETSQINLGKRFMLEIIADDPCTYKVTSVDSVTERFYEAGAVRGFLIMNVTQDLYNPETDNKELMICDYIELDQPLPPPQPDATVAIQFSGKPTIRYGGSAKKFTAEITYDSPETEEPVEPIAAVVEWEVVFDPKYEGKIQYTVDGNIIRLSAADDVTLLGAIVTLNACFMDATATIEVEVVS